MSEIDWNSELRKFEREFDGLPPDSTPVEVRERRAAERRAKDRVDQRAAAIGAWVRLLLVVALGAAMQWWPYSRSCGTGLLAYIGAVAVVAIGGFWTAAATWRARMAKTHALAMAAMLWGFGLLAIEALPRVGYAKPDPDRPAGWRCSVAAPAPRL